MVLTGLPRWQSGKESICQCRRCKRSGLDPRSRKGQHTPVFLPGEFHGQRSPAGDTESAKLMRLSEHTKGDHALVFCFYLLLLPSTCHCSILPGPLLSRVHTHTTAPSRTLFWTILLPWTLPVKVSALRCSLNASSFKSLLKLLAWNHLKTHWSSPFCHTFTLLCVKTKS